MKWILYRLCNLGLAGPVEKMRSRMLGYAFTEMQFPLMTRIEFTTE